MVESKSENLSNSKSKVLEFLKANGPSIPVKISTHLGVDTMLASAFLADLLSDKEIKMSKMKVGNSPIYFLSGQESRLQEFSNYLGGKERQAFDLLKEKKILRDRNQEPAIRVALRSIKDFAFAFKVREETFWRFYLVDHHEAMGNVENNIPKPKVTVMSKIKEAFVGEEVKEGKVEGTVKEIVPEVSKEEVVPGVSKEVEATRDSAKEVSFGSRVEGFLGDNEFQIVRKILARKRDYSAVVRTSGESGIKDYLCICKDKKSITEGDVLKFLEEGKTDKFPVLILSTGTLNKKAEDWVEYLGETVSFRRIE